MDATQTTGLQNGPLKADFLTVFDATGVDPSNTTSYKRGAFNGHVYTRPGTYYVRVYVESGGIRGESSVQTIVVHDPSSYYASTYCFSNSVRRNFTACPNTDSRYHIVTDNFQSALNYGAPYSRLLFDAGSSWNITSVQAQGTGPQHIGSYREATAPLSQRPRLISSAQGYSSAVSLANQSNIIFTGFQITGNFTGDPASSNLTGITVDGTHNALVFDNIIENTNNHGIYLGHSHADLGIVQNLIRFNGQYGLYGGAQRLVVMSNTITDVRSQHGIRIQGGAYSYFWKNALTNIAGHTSITIRGNNTISIIMNNLLEQILSVMPQNETSAEYVRDVQIDGNTFRPRLGLDRLNFAIRCAARNVVVRNNIALKVSTFFDATNHPLVGACSEVDIDHNTFYNDGNILNDEHYLLTATSASTDFKLRNNIYYSLSSTSWARAIQFAAPLTELESNGNLFYMPNQTSSWRGFYGGSNSYTFSSWQSAGMDQSSINGAPYFVSTDPNNIGFLIPDSNSPLVDRAISSTGLSNNFDANGDLRPRDGNGDNRAVADVGALERQ
ncbi:MAG: right-handed parallel beta-helix repeat-containing protein [Oligoflexia bacterium]|nr:right-handed parallel beta-helix repeat-containing protein [Oligoflexia bacterium]